MSKMAKEKAEEAYPYPTVMDLVTDEEECGKLVEKAKLGQSAYIKGYEQAMKDMMEHADKIKYLSDEVGYAYACGCKKTMQEFMEKAEKVFEEMYMPKIKFELFKQYMEKNYFPPKDKDTATIIERSTK